MNIFGVYTVFNCHRHGPLARYVKLRVAHAPRMPGTFSPPPTSKETASQRSRHASRHVRDARVVMHVGIANPRWRGKRSQSIPGAYTTCNFTYLAKVPWRQERVFGCMTIGFIFLAAKIEYMPPRKQIVMLAICQKSSKAPNATKVFRMLCLPQKIYSSSTGPAFIRDLNFIIS